MFARTARLTLRPGWIEDAPELARAIGHESVVRNLSHVPWPYRVADAEAFLAKRGRDRDGAFFLICEHRDEAAPIVGGIGVHPIPEGIGYELGYWLTPSAWGRGIATEAGRAVLGAARSAMPIRRLSAGHFVDNPASGRVLRKLGFRPTGRIEPRHSLARGGEAACATFEIDLCEGGAGSDDPDARARMAA